MGKFRTTVTDEVLTRKSGRGQNEEKKRKRQSSIGKKKKKAKSKKDKLKENEAKGDDNLDHIKDIDEGLEPLFNEVGLRTKDHKIYKFKSYEEIYSCEFNYGSLPKYVKILKFETRKKEN